MKRLLRRPLVTLSALVLAVSLCVTLCFLSGYLGGQKQALEDTKQNFEVVCVVTDRAGAKSHGLRLPESYLKVVRDPSVHLSGLVRELQVTRELAYLQNYSEFVPVTAVSAPGCDERLDPALGAEVRLTEDFYGSSEPVCLVSATRYAELEEMTLSLTLVDPLTFRPGLSDPPEPTELRVVGCYAGAGDGVFVPFAYAEGLMRERTGSVTCDSMRFLVADNEKIDELREAASLFFGEVDPNADASAAPKYALIVRDEMYRMTLSTIAQNILRTEYLLPFVLILSLGISFLVSFLATRSENRNYALMRTVGLTQGRLFASVLIEQSIPALLAAVAVGALMRQPLYAGAYLLCHLTGCCIAVLRAVRVPPTMILREQE